MPKPGAHREGTQRPWLLRKTCGMRQGRKMQSISRHTHLPSTPKLCPKLQFLVCIQEETALTTQSRQGQAPGPCQGALLQVPRTPNEHPNITHTLAGNRPEGSGAQAGDSAEAEKPLLQTRGLGHGTGTTGTQPGDPGPPAAAHPGLKPRHQTVVPLALSPHPLRGPGPGLGLGGQGGVTV